MNLNKNLLKQLILEVKNELEEGPVAGQPTAPVATGTAQPAQPANNAAKSVNITPQQVVILKGWKESLAGELKGNPASQAKNTLNVMKPIFDQLGIK